MKNTNREYINSAKTKKLLLTIAKDFRGGKFTRVSDERLNLLADMHVANCKKVFIDIPSKGKTI